MPINSMTGFASATGSCDALEWSWDLRSVNGRGLDVRLRLPSGFERLEAELKPRVQARLSRGSITASLNVARAETGATLRVDPVARDAMIAAAEEIRAEVDGPPLRAELLLAIRGVLVSADASGDTAASDAALSAIAATFDEALDRLVQARADEGQRLQPVVRAQVDAIDGLTARIASHPSRTPERLRERLEAQLTRLLSTESGAAALDADRLHQEAVLLAARADIEEEVKRLDAHVAAARDLLDGTEPVGRRLDFLTQEFNREANTICSKSNDTEVTAMGLELKTVIDRMREQVQNIE